MAAFVTAYYPLIGVGLACFVVGFAAGQLLGK